MKASRRGKTLVWLGMVLLLGGCGSDPEVALESAAERPPASAAPVPEGLLVLSAESIGYGGIETEAVSEREMAEEVEATGRLVLNEDRTVRVGAYVPGRVMEVLVHLGDRVVEGQILARVHTHEVHDAGANLVQAKATLAQKRTAAAFAKTNLERAERLLEARALSAYERDRIRVEEMSAREEVAHAEAELERARGHFELLGLDEEKLDYEALVQIRAPRAGILLERHVTAGTSVNPGDPLFTLSDLGTLWVQVEVGEDRLPALRVGAPLTLSVAAYPGESFAGRTLRLGEQLNPQTRRIEVRGLVENRAGRLKPEMYVTAAIASGARTRARTVPLAAIQEVDGAATVFVARGENRFERRTVQTGRSEAGQVEILSGITSGERVVTRGSFLLKSELLKNLLEEEE